MKTANPMTEKPLVSILLSVYRPPRDWLVALLQSLNTQTYENLELLVWDDCPEEPLDEALLSTHITAFPYTLWRGAENVGSNAAFGALTARATGDLIAYCDQDDVWHSDKLSRLVALQREADTPLVYCNAAIIDGEGRQIGACLQDIFPRHRMRHGEGLAPFFMLQNCIPGCALVVKTDVAKQALPFDAVLVHDQWVALQAALTGSIGLLNESLLDYRQHDHNQTGSLKGVVTKADYKKRLLQAEQTMAVMATRYGDEPQLQQDIADMTVFIKARLRYFERHAFKDGRLLWRYRHYSKFATYFELVLPFLPTPVFKRFIRRLQSGG